MRKAAVKTAARTATAVKTTNIRTAIRTTNEEQKIHSTHTCPHETRFERAERAVENGRERELYGQAEKPTGAPRAGR